MLGRFWRIADIESHRDLARGFAEMERYGMVLLGGRRAIVCAWSWLAGWLAVGDTKTRTHVLIRVCVYYLPRMEIADIAGSKLCMCYRRCGEVRRG